MTNHIKMGLYTNAVMTRINRAKHVALIESMEKRQVHRKRRQFINLNRKIKLVHLKKEGVAYVRHSECDADNDTECWLYFDVRYIDPSLCYNENTDSSWFHYSTPGLFKNVTNLCFEDSIISWVPEQSYPHITIVWTTRK